VERTGLSLVLSFEADSPAAQLPHYAIYLNEEVNMKVTICMVSLVLLLGCFVTGCSMVETRKVDVDPYSLPATPVEKKLPISAALVLDNEFKTYAIKHELISIVPGTSETAAYQIGPHLERYAKDVATDVFQHTSVFNSVDEAASKCDVILEPKAVRSSTNITTPIQVMLVIEWQVKDRSGQNLIWLTSIESQASVKPAAFGHGKAQRETYTRIFYDLSLKTIEAFRKSPEVTSISGPQK
jgi:hypothetical protein